MPKRSSALNMSGCMFFGSDARFAVIGNSHATELSYSLGIELNKINESILQYTISGCPHIFVPSENTNDICDLWHKKQLDEIVNNNNIEFVIISYRNENWINEDLYRNSLIKITELLISANKKVIYVMQVPLLPLHINEYIKMHIGNQLSKSVIKRNYWSQIYPDSSDFKSFLSEEVLLIDPSRLFCDSKNCYPIKNNKALYFDRNHMSLYGASLITDEIIRLIYFTD